MISVSRAAKYFSRPLLDDEVLRLNEIHGASMKVKTVFGGTVELVSYLERDTILHVVARISDKAVIIVSRCDSQIFLYDHAGTMVPVGDLMFGDQSNYGGWSFSPIDDSGLPEYRDPGIFPVIHLAYKLLQSDRIVI